MKKLISLSRLIVAVGAISSLAIIAAWASDTSASQPVIVTGTQSADQSATPTPSVSTPMPAKLPYGVDDVLKLSRAQISEDIIVNYVQNSGTIYNLGTTDIVYLRNQGVSDRVINTMLDQRKRVSEMAAQTAPPPAPTAPPAAAAPSYADASAAAPAYNSTPAAPAATQPASTVYVIPYPQATSAYYGYPYPYYPYYGYYGSAVSFGFSFGGGWGCYRGGYHGGYHGGGWHHR